jgi:hypothetical protein
MIHKLNFITNSLFKNVIYDSDSDYWHFEFADKINVSVSGFWRLLNKSKIVLVSLDHGHLFGLPKPVDLVEEIKKTLAAKKLIKIEVDENTADLTLILTDQYKIEIFIASSGYETYNFFIDDKQYIGLGSGDIATI